MASTKSKSYSSENSGSGYRRQSSAYSSSASKTNRSGSYHINAVTSPHYSKKSSRSSARHRPDSGYGSTDRTRSSSPGNYSSNQYKTGSGSKRSYPTTIEPSSGSYPRSKLLPKAHKTFYSIRPKYKYYGHNPSDLWSRGVSDWDFCDTLDCCCPNKPPDDDDDLPCVTNDTCTNCPKILDDKEYFTYLNNPALWHSKAAKSSSPADLARHYRRVESKALSQPSNKPTHRSQNHFLPPAKTANKRLVPQPVASQGWLSPSASRPLSKPSSSRFIPKTVVSKPVLDQPPPAKVFPPKKIVSKAVISQLRPPKPIPKKAESKPVIALTSKELTPKTSIITKSGGKRPKATKKPGTKQELNNKATAFSRSKNNNGAAQDEDDEDDDSDDGSGYYASSYNTSSSATNSTNRTDASAAARKKSIKKTQDETASAPVPTSIPLFDDDAPKRQEKHSRISTGSAKAANMLNEIPETKNETASAAISIPIIDDGTIQSQQSASPRLSVYPRDSANGRSVQNGITETKDESASAAISQPIMDDVTLNTHPRSTWQSINQPGSIHSASDQIEISNTGEQLTPVKIKDVGEEIELISTPMALESLPTETPISSLEISQPTMNANNGEKQLSVELMQSQAPQIGDPLSMVTPTQNYTVGKGSTGLQDVLVIHTPSQQPKKSSKTQKGT